MTGCFLYDVMIFSRYRDQQAVVQIDASDVDFEIMREREEALKKLEVPAFCSLFIFSLKISNEIKVK